MCIRTRIHVYIHMCVSTCVCICIYVCACVRVYKFRIRVSKDILAWQFSDSFRSWKNDRCSRKKKKKSVSTFISPDVLIVTQERNMYTVGMKTYRKRRRDASVRRVIRANERRKRVVEIFSFFFVLFLLFFFFFFYYYYYCLNLYFYATLVERENGFRSFRFVSWPRESRFARNENYLQLPLRSSSPAFFDDKTRTKRYVHVLMSTI